MSEAVLQTEKTVGVEVTTSAFKSVCLDAAGNLINSYTATMIRGDDTAPQLVAFIKELLVKYGDFDRIGITIPGLINRDTRRVAFSAAFPEHQEIDLLTELEKVTKLKILIENDANAAAFGEYMLGAGRGSRSMFYVTLGAGVGGAFIFDGKIWHGTSGFAGEFGYLAIDEDGTRLEEVASATNIIRRTRSRFHQDSTSSLGKMPEAEITVSDVVREARDGDDFAQLMLERTGGYVGTAIAGVINLLNIEKIVIGGEVMQAEDVVLGAIVERARQLSFKPSFQTTQIVVGELGSSATAIGVALLSKSLP
ncbi:MAG TPA: ROK family protein [Pyrinomonadaceae bacterium]|jgi:glucokinase|nr:ROK family protein [Pyrinomonadaceae bacterium]